MCPIGLDGPTWLAKDEHEVPTELSVTVTRSRSVSTGAQKHNLSLARLPGSAEPYSLVQEPTCIIMSNFSLWNFDKSTIKPSQQRLASPNFSIFGFPVSTHAHLIGSLPESLLLVAPGV